MVENLQKIQQLRREVDQAQEEEFDEQVARHRAQVERLRAAEKFRKTTSRLDFLAIGDSWFNYPVTDDNIPISLPNFVDFSIIHQLRKIGNPHPLVLNLAYPGKASTEVLSYKKQKWYMDQLTNGPWVNGKGPDAILVSMGGDDLVGDQFAIYLTYGGATNAPSKRLNGVLDLVAASYLDLFELRDNFDHTIPVFGHCYDFPDPSGTPIAGFLGPWLRPSLDFALYEYPEYDRTIAHKMVESFYDTLKGLADDPDNNFHLVNTKGTLTCDDVWPTGWANELHPYEYGFKQLADLFLTELRNHFGAGKI